MIIEKADLTNADEIAFIEEKVFKSNRSCEKMKRFLSDENNEVYIAKTDEKTVAYGSLNVILDEGYIIDIAVLEEYRRQKAATRILQAIIDFAKKNRLKFLTLEVRESNEAAITLYHKFGFFQAGKRKNYYSDPKENALLLTKTF